MLREETTHLGVLPQLKCYPIPAQQPVDGGCKFFLTSLYIKRHMIVSEKLVVTTLNGLTHILKKELNSIPDCKLVVRKHMSAERPFDFHFGLQCYAQGDPVTSYCALPVRAPIGKSSTEAAVCDTLIDLRHQAAPSAVVYDFGSSRTGATFPFAEELGHHFLCHQP